MRTEILATMKTKILALWDGSRHDIGSYKDEWLRMLVAACDDADNVAARAAVRVAASVACAAADAAYRAAAAAYRDDAAAAYWFKRAEGKMDVLREN